MNDNAQYYVPALSASIKALSRHNETANKELGKWAATVLSKDEELLKWIIECSRDGYSIARRRKLQNKLLWLNTEDYRRTGIRVHASWNSYWGIDVVALEVHVTRDYRLHIGIPFAAFTSKAGYAIWRNEQKKQAEAKKQAQKDRNLAIVAAAKKRLKEVS